MRRKLSPASPAANANIPGFRASSANCTANSEFLLSVVEKIFSEPTNVSLFIPAVTPSTAKVRGKNYTGSLIFVESVQECANFSGFRLVVSVCARAPRQNLRERVNESFNQAKDFDTSVCWHQAKAFSCTRHWIASLPATRAFRLRAQLLPLPALLEQFCR